jgi:hypothetical protein
MDEKIYDEPTKVTVQDGRVLLNGPDGVDVSMTPEAAAETSDRLLEGAAEANGLRLAEERRRAARVRRAPPAREIP